MFSSLNSPNINYTAIKGEQYCPIKHAKTDDAVQLPCSHIFDRELIERWININTKCPVCWRSQAEFYTLKQKSIHVIKSSFRFLNKYGFIVFSPTVHFVSSLVSYGRIAHLRAQHHEPVCLNLAASSQLRNAYFTSSQFFQISFILFSNVVDTYNPIESSDSLGEAVSRRLVQFGNISLLMTTAAMGFGVSSEPYARPLPSLYILGFVSLVAGTLIRVAQCALLRENRFDLDIVIFCGAALAITMCGIITYIQHNEFFNGI